MNLNLVRHYFWLHTSRPIFRQTSVGTLLRHRCLQFPSLKRCSRLVEQAAEGAGYAYKANWLSAFETLHWASPAEAACGFVCLCLKKKKKLTLHLLSKRLTKMSSDKNSAFKKKSVSSEIGITAFKKPVAILGPMKFCFLRMCPFPAPSPHHLVPWDPSAFFFIYSFLPTSPDILMKRENCLGQSRKAFLY